MTVGIFLPDGVEARICSEIAARAKMGLAKYGVTVAENPLSLLQWIQHAKEEALDQAIYLERMADEVRAQIERSRRPEGMDGCGNVGMEASE